LGKRPQRAAEGRRGMGMKSNEVTRAVIGGAIEVHREPWAHLVGPW
jgi:hypothetical protein